MVQKAFFTVFTRGTRSPALFRSICKGSHAQNTGLERLRRFFGRGKAAKPGSFQPIPAFCPRPKCVSLDLQGDVVVTLVRAAG